MACTAAILPSDSVDRDRHPSIMLAESPQRDRDIEAFQNHIRTCAATGIRTLKYNMSILGVVRLDEVPGRGDTVYNRWNYKDAAAQNPPLTRAGEVGEDAFWERINYFLERVAPVAAAVCVPGVIATSCVRTFRSSFESWSICDGCSLGRSWYSVPPQATFRIWMPRQMASTGRRRSRAASSRASSVASRDGLISPSFGCGAEP